MATSEDHPWPPARTSRWPLTGTPADHRVDRDDKHARTNGLGSCSRDEGAPPPMPALPGRHDLLLLDPRDAGRTALRRMSPHAAARQPTLPRVVLGASLERYAHGRRIHQRSSRVPDDRTTTPSCGTNGTQRPGKPAPHRTEKRSRSGSAPKAQPSKCGSTGTRSGSPYSYGAPFGATSSSTTTSTTPPSDPRTDQTLSQTSKPAVKAPCSVTN